MTDLPEAFSHQNIEDLSVSFKAAAFAFLSVFRLISFPQGSHVLVNFCVNQHAEKLTVSQHVDKFIFGQSCIILSGSVAENSCVFKYLSGGVSKDILTSEV